MARKSTRKQNQPVSPSIGPGEDVIDAGRAESEIFEPDMETKLEFAEASRLGGSRQQLMDELREHHSRTPELSAGDIDADWARADIGEETVGGSSPTPDQDIVEELGRALGVTYQDNEPLRATEKIMDRDRTRWELDPASSEEFGDRTRHEGEELPSK